MKNNEINSPFYTESENGELRYLNKYKICTIPNDMNSKKYILRNEGVLLNKYQKKDYNETTLVLEPHPDDFALSAIGYCLNKTNTIVLNVFAKTSLKYFAWADKINITQDTYKELRIDESKFAIESVLGEKFITMGETSTRINKKSLQKIEEEFIYKIKEILKKNSSIKTIMVPMGIGNHPDHIFVYQSFINNINTFNKYNIVLYPEFPYARCKAWYGKRLEDIEKTYKLTPIIVDVTKSINTFADVASCYKSQFDDINRNQMLALMTEDARAIANEYNRECLVLVYFKIIKEKEYED